MPTNNEQQDGPQDDDGLGQLNLDTVVENLEDEFLVEDDDAVEEDETSDVRLQDDGSPGADNGLDPTAQDRMDAELLEHQKNTITELRVLLAPARREAEETRETMRKTEYLAQKDSDESLEREVCFIEE